MYRIDYEETYRTEEKDFDSKYCLIIPIILS
jgi:hypothetical protein